MGGLDVNVKTAVRMSHTPLHAAVSSSPDKYEMIRMLVNAGADIDARDHNNDTAACFSAYTLRDPKNPPLQVHASKKGLFCKQKSILRTGCPRKNLVVTKV